MARPLMKTTEKGEPYTRLPSVEAKIDCALMQDWATLARRARIVDPKAPDYLPSECLVHLIRDAIRRGDHRVATVLMPPLLVRCELNLNKTVPDSVMRNAEAVREEILSSFQLLFTDDAAEDALDYYECRFGRAFKTLRIDHFRAAVSEREDLTDLPVATTRTAKRCSTTRCSRVCRAWPASGRRRRIRPTCRRC